MTNNSYKTDIWEEAINFVSMIVRDHSLLTDDEFEQQFEKFTFKPGLFSHEAHLRLAYIHVQKYGLARAEQNMVEQIKGYAEYYGANNKFNKTVTIASVKAMHHFMEKSTSDSFQGLMKEYPRLLTNFKDILSQHYSFNVFGDSRAKKEFILPDLLPF